jgi:hypothetical protein
MMMPPVHSMHAGHTMLTQSGAEPSRGFATELQAATDRIGSARQAAEQLVSTSLVLPILASMREGTFLSGPFKPGTMERRFGPMLDVHTAEAITSSSRFDLVDSVVDQLVGPSGKSETEWMA